jgi:DNA-binding response OmpR family regulator
VIQETGRLKYNGLVLDATRQHVTVSGEPHHLTPKECRLLATFMRHPDEVLSRKYLMREVWDTDFSGDTRTIEVHVSWLRRKIEANPREPQIIRTVHGVGYIFNTNLTHF